MDFGDERPDPPRHQASERELSLSILDVRSSIEASTEDASCRTVKFGELSVEFDQRVLAPREWTRMQSEWAVELLTTLGPGRILELSAGVGHIGLLAARRSGRALVQIESDPVAARFARRNAQALGLARHVSVRWGANETMLGVHEMFPLVLADPPYLTTNETSAFPEDPSHTINGGRDGLEVVKRTVRVVAEHLAPGGACLLQLRDSSQADAIQSWLEREGLNLRRCDQRFVERGGVVLMRKVFDKW